MLLILLWVSSVLSNVVHCTTAGAVACWWVSTDDELIAMDECERENNTENKTEVDIDREIMIFFFFYGR